MTKKSQSMSIDLLVTLGIFLILIIGFVFIQIDTEKNENQKTEVILEKKTVSVNNALNDFRKNDILDENNELNVEKFNEKSFDDKEYKIVIIKDGNVYNVAE